MEILNRMRAGGAPVRIVECGERYPKTPSEILTLCYCDKLRGGHGMRMEPAPMTAKRKSAKTKKATATAADVLPGLVADWGGFEQFVADLNRTAEDVAVEHNVKLTDTDGVKRQIDVTVRYRQGLVDHLVLVECKFWKRNVPREKVDAFANTVDKLKASRGIMFSAVGFQTGAIEAVKSLPISLFKVREPTFGEWGAPGRYFDVFLVVASVSIGPFSTPNAVAIPPIDNPNINFDIRIGDDTQTKTGVFLSGGVTTTLEELIVERSTVVARELYAKEIAKGVPFFPVAGHRRICSTAMTFFTPDPMRPIAMPNVLFPCMSFPVGLSIMQSRIQVDRAAGYTFAVAVEDCVTRGVTAATRRPSENITTMFPLQAKDIDPKETIRNGSIMTVWLKGLQSFTDFENLPQGVAVDSELPQDATPK